MMESPETSPIPAPDLGTPDGQLRQLATTVPMTWLAGAASGRDSSREMTAGDLRLRLSLQRTHL
jgi:hypothetical protein